MSPDDSRNLLRVLANFAVWLEPYPVKSCDMGYYIQLARHYVESGGIHMLIDIPEDRLGWCDLCGQQYVVPLDHGPEEITGHGYSWCPACLDQQHHAFFMIGSDAYQAAWKTDTGG